jgi:hypothetical protein
MWRYTFPDGMRGEFRCTDNTGETRFDRHGPVRVSEDHRYLAHADGTPFFWLGDTAWNGPLLASPADWDAYLADRAAKRFSVIQFVMAAPWRTADTDAEGQVAYSGRDPVSIHPEFFQRMDHFVERTAERGFLSAIVLLWAIQGDENPGYSLPEDDAARLARYMVARYAAYPVVWILAGDGRYDGESAEKWCRIGRAVFPTAEHAPVAMHAQGTAWPFEPFRNEPWFDLCGYQSGHGDGDATWEWIQTGSPAFEWLRSPHKPLLNLEPPYEGHLAYQSRQPHSDLNVRRACYWSMLNTPPVGLTYGGHGIWSWQTEPGLPRAHARTGLAQPWSIAAQLPGSAQMGHLADLFTSLRWWRLRPSGTLLSEQPGAPGETYVAASLSLEGDAAVVYLPQGASVDFTPGAPCLTSPAYWFDPRTGAETAAISTEDLRYTAPDRQDWVLVFRPS